VAARHQHLDDDRDVPDGVPDPECAESRRSAIQAKLDEIIRATTAARNEFIGIEHMTQDELEGIKRVLERECGDDTTHHESIERLLGRL